MQIVVLALPMQGHVNVCLALAKLLAAQGFSITFVLTEDLEANHGKPLLQEEEEEEEEEEEAASNPIQFATVASEESCFATSFEMNSTLRIMQSMRPGFEKLLAKLVLSEKGVCCIMADSYVTWTQQVAMQFNLPRFVLYVSNAHTLAVSLHASSLISQGLAPIQDPDMIVDCIPGVLPLRAGDLPQTVQSMPEFTAEMVKDIHEAAGVIFNSVYSWEIKPLEVISKSLPIFPLGPFLLMSGFAATESEKKPGLWTEDRSCLAWLDTMPPSSVLYVSFGSLATMSVNQIRELAEGLEASGQPFLWVIRTNAVKGSLAAVLPEAFAERTKTRGLIIRWAPQVEVLAHVAVGGFLTHCGWNSITENLSMRSVPMICWPHIGEQRLNARLLVDEWKVGLHLQEDNLKEDVADAVKVLMQGEVARQLRRNALRLKEIACFAVQSGGSSQTYLKALVQKLKQLSLS